MSDNILPLIQAVVFYGVTLSMAWSLLTRRHTPRGILVDALWATFALGIPALSRTAAALPWYVWWLVAATYLAALVLACRRTLRAPHPDEREEPPPSLAMLAGGALAAGATLAIALIGASVGG